MNEIADAAQLGIVVDEALIPVRDDVRAACEILGLDPLQLACEGRFAAFIPEKHVSRALEIMKLFPTADGARRIGQVLADPDPLVSIKRSIGARRILDMPTGEQLPRIC